MEGLYDSLIEQLSSLGPDMRRLGHKNRLKVMEQVAYLKRKAERMIELRHETALRRFDHISLRCLPGGRLQERVYNIVPYWNEYGIEWVERLTETPLSFFRASGGVFVGAFPFLLKSGIMTMSVDLPRSEQG